MNRYARETGATHSSGWAVRAALTSERNRNPGRRTWATFDYFNYMIDETRRALLGIDAPTAWSGRNERLRRMVAQFRALPGPPLP